MHGAWTIGASDSCILRSRGSISWDVAMGTETWTGLAPVSHGVGSWCWDLDATVSNKR